MVEVAEFSEKLARKTRQASYLISTGRLSQIETSSSAPGIYKLGTLSLVYHIPFVEWLKVYGIKAKN